MADVEQETSAGPAHTMQRVIDEEKGTIFAYCSKCPWQKTGPLFARESVDEAAADHLILGNMYGFQTQGDTTMNNAHHIDNQQNATTDEDAAPDQTADTLNDNSPNVPAVENTDGTDTSLQEEELTDEEAIASDELTVGKNAHETEAQTGAGSAREGVVLAKHDDGTVTVGFFANVERVAADTLKTGSPYDATDDE